MAKDVVLKEPVGPAGTITFELKTDKRYANGNGQNKYTQTLVSLPGIFEIIFRQNRSVVNISWVWINRDGRPKFADIIKDIVDLPGPETYFLQYTWDSTRGISEAYINGLPLRIPGCRFDPWQVKKAVKKVRSHYKGNLKVNNLTVTNTYTAPEKLLAAVPKAFLNKHEEFVGTPKPPQPKEEIGKRRGKLLYETSLADAKSVKDWVAEGPLVLKFEDKTMQMQSKDDAQHTVFWCPKDFPDSFIAEWDVEIFSRYGLCIVFFAANGENGEDIFAPSLPKRDGNFGHYIGGKIVSYHVSYYANVENFQMGRPDSNLRKNNKFYRVGGGPVAIKPGAKGWQHIRLVKDGNRIQLYNNGVLYVDWTDDDPKRYGKPHTDGKIGLRQMATTIGRYRNFKVWALNPKNTKQEKK
jgi:hypothetical protein